MPKSKPNSRDANSIAASMVLEVTDSAPVNGEDLIADPKLRKAFKAAKKKAKKAKVK